MELQVTGQPRQEFQAYFLAPGKYRQELSGTYNIIDTHAGRIVSVAPAQTQVMVMTVKGEPKDKGATD